MKRNVESSDTFTAAIGITLSILFIFLFVWFIRSLPPPTESNTVTSEEAASYEQYKSEQLLNESAQQEACIDQEMQDVERYGEWTADTYDCTK